MSLSEDEEDEPPSDAQIDSLINILGVWERSTSKTRRTIAESLEVRILPLGDVPLSAIIRRLIERTLGGRPTPALLGFAIHPPGWRTAYHIPLRPPAQNTPEAIAAALERMAAEYEEELNLYDGTCRTKVCAVWPPGTDLSGRFFTFFMCIFFVGPWGACANTLEEASAAAAGIRQCQSWVPVVNPGDTHCLARAVVLGLGDRWHRRLGRSNADYRLWTIGQRAEAGSERALALMDAAHLPPNRVAYGVRDAQRIQQWLDERLGPREVRLVLFDREKGLRVAWKAPLPAHFTLHLVCCAAHWSYIPYVHQLFKVTIFCANLFFILSMFQCQMWCPDCEHRVERRTHPAGCRALCPMCFRFGVDRPCARDGNARRCDVCHLAFPNADCYEAHLRHVDPAAPGWANDGRRQRQHRSLCEERRACLQCHGIVWPRRQAAHQCPVQSEFPLQ